MNSYVSWIHICIRVYQGSRCQILPPWQADNEARISAFPSKPATPSESPAPGRCNPMGFRHLQEHRLLSCCRSQWQLQWPSLWAWEWGKNAYYTVHSPYYTVHSINSNKTDPDSSDSNVHAIIWAIFENEALVRRLHECPIFAKTLQISVGWRKATMTLNKIPNVAHHLIFSLIQTIHLILKHPQNGSSKGIFSMPGQQGELMKSH